MGAPAGAMSMGGGHRAGLESVLVKCRRLTRLEATRGTLRAPIGPSPIMEQNENRHDNEELFAKADAHASYTTFEQAGHLVKGDYIMIRNRPCKITEVSKKAPGKHGAAKCHFVSKEIFTNDKMEIIYSAHHNVEVPIIKKTEFLCMYRCSRS